MSSGSRVRNADTVSMVSSTDSVVWDSQAVGWSSAKVTDAACSGLSTSVMASGASPMVPSTSSCPAWPISTI